MEGEGSENEDHVICIDQWSALNYENYRVAFFDLAFVEMKDGTMIEVATRRKNEFLALFGYK
jgi:ssDNA-specific exonuclease RecJ